MISALILNKVRDENLNSFLQNNYHEIISSMGYFPPYLILYALWNIENAQLGHFMSRISTHGFDFSCRFYANSTLFPSPQLCLPSEAETETPPV